jgi:hypothetical protein
VNTISAEFRATPTAPRSLRRFRQRGKSGG